MSSRLSLRLTVFSLLLFALFLAGCKGILGGQTPAGHLIYNAPTKKTVPIGEFLPGTGIQYVGPVEGKGAELRIDGERAYKKVADSVDWKGTPVDGVELDLGQRILWYNEESLGLGGTVKIDVADVNPQSLSRPPNTPIHFAIPTTYQVKVGETVPGTLLRIEGIDPDKGVEFSGFPEEQYRFRKVADSLQWIGSLRPGVSLVLELRVAWVRGDKVQLGGIANIFLTP
jgi:hypothetical protein